MNLSFKHIYTGIALILLTTFSTFAQSVSPSERILGKWETPEKTIGIQVYMVNKDYKAKIIYYTDTGGKPMDYWTDKRNPDPALRSRKILGMEILRGLKYSPKTDSWEDGMIYDSKHGREWNAAVTFDKQGLMHVKGYWHFKWIGKTMVFKRME